MQEPSCNSAMLTFLQGTQLRLGSLSPVQMMDKHVLQTIASLTVPKDLYVLLSFKDIEPKIGDPYRVLGDKVICSYDLAALLSGIRIEQKECVHGQYGITGYEYGIFTVDDDDNDDVGFELTEDDDDDDDAVTVDDEVAVTVDDDEGFEVTSDESLRECLSTKLKGTNDPVVYYKESKRTGRCSYRRTCKFVQKFSIMGYGLRETLYAAYEVNPKFISHGIFTAKEDVGDSYEVIELHP